MKNEVKRWTMQNFFSVAAIIVAVANLWVATKLFPIITDIQDIGNKVEAIGEKVKELEVAGIDNYADHAEIRKDLLVEIRYVRDRVDNIYNLLR